MIVAGKENNHLNSSTVINRPVLLYPAGRKASPAHVKQSFGRTAGMNSEKHFNWTERESIVTFVKTVV